MKKLQVVLMALAFVVGASSFNNAEAATGAKRKKQAVKRAVRRAPAYPDWGYGQHRFPVYGPGTCGNSGWHCGPNNGGGDPHGSGGNGG